MEIFRKFLTILAVISVCIALSSAKNETASTTTATTTTAAPSSTTKVSHRPVKEEGCYWTLCKSPLTYDLKCPPETEEQNENDEMPCEGIFLSYQCCPRKDVVTKPPTPPVVGEDKVIPQGV
ncbi:uncharacterized protein LOC110854249 [Folsomia candida]|uniref:uncharacterized protein LOC110854249 n=1 Tax=Folsomia candida TaxID=158441 RepID=UPI000B8FBE9F|nr:uncharacterized protein LOC110854249 [Folsomia candida]